MKYLDLLNQTAEEAQKANNELMAEEMSISLQSELFCCKKKIAKIKACIQTAKTARPLSFVAITSAQNELQLVERHQNQLVELQKELF